MAENPNLARIAESLERVYGAGHPVLELPIEKLHSEFDFIQ
jgi:hypothetical protein